MKKSNIYLAQPAYMNSNSVFLPAAIGALAAYAFSQPDIEAAYDLCGIIFMREKIADVVAAMDSPVLYGFSCYIWNIEYNKRLAAAVKAAAPDCTVVFGGPQVPEGDALLRECPFVDVLIHGEGELPFAALLRALRDKTSFDGIAGLSFRKNGGFVTEPAAPLCSVDLPSPVTSGFYDRVMREHPDTEFIPLVETSRGCPNRCAYCSWGHGERRMRLFPLERVFADIEWAARHHMDFLGFSDSNFGLFPRDEQITDKILELHGKYGFPKKVQVSFAKDSGERVFRISEKLNAAGLCKGVTLSFQTMSPVAQKNIGRSNIDIEYYRFLLQKYAQTDIVTYSELILGLPGETAESFIDGIEQLLEYGQHSSMMIHLCECLPLSPMGDPAYIEKYGIKTVRIPLNQPHANINDPQDIPEFSRIVVGTYSMDENDWMRVTLFGMCVLCFHHLGLLQLPALYLYFEKGVKYVDFYSALLAYYLKKGDSVFNRIRMQLSDMLTSGAGAVISDARFGPVTWTFEEYAFLSFVYEKEAFYREMDAFLAAYIPDAAFREELLRYQSFIVKGVNCPHAEFTGSYAWRDYFYSLRLNKKTEPVSRPVRYTVDDPNACTDWPEYARKVVWYGRRGGKNLYSSEITEADVCPGLTD